MPSMNKPERYLKKATIVEDDELEVEVVIASFTGNCSSVIGGLAKRVFFSFIDAEQRILKTESKIRKNNLVIIVVFVEDDVNYNIFDDR